MPLGDPSVGFGEYVVMWSIVAVAVFALIGWMLGTGLGGTVIFLIFGVVSVVLAYAILVRLWNLLLHGSISAGNDRERGDI